MVDLDLCLVNPNNRNPSPFAAIEPPLWLGLLHSHYIEEPWRKYGKRGGRIVPLDAEAENWTVAETVEMVKRIRPRETIIVVMGNNPSVSSTPKMVVAEELLRHLPEAKLTGLHPLAVHHPKAIPTPFTDCPLLPMASSLTSDTFPLYRAHNWHCLDDLDRRSPYAVLYTSLNCPFTCYYCNVHALYEDKQMRWRPLEAVFAELELLAQYKVRNIKVWDELFCLSEPWVNTICDHIISQGYDFNLWAYARADTVTESMLAKMRQAGFTWLAYGFESAQAPVRQQARKKFADAQVRRAIDMTRAAGINIIANFMFGLPGETEDDMKASLDMAIRENFEYVNFYVALPYPGSPWWDSLKVKPTDWSSFSQFSPHICAESRIVQFRDDAFRTYFSRPEYLSLVRGKFGLKAEAHIHEMLQWGIANRGRKGSIISVKGKEASYG